MLDVHLGSHYTTDNSTTVSIFGFTSGQDTITTLHAGTGVNYSPLPGAAADYAHAATAAVLAFSVATAQSSAIGVQVGSDTYVFIDSNHDGALTTADEVIKLVGVSASSIHATDFTA